MRYIKSDRLNILHIGYRYKGFVVYGIKILAGFQLDGPGELMDEADMWAKSSEALGRDQVLDFVHPKKRGEVLVTGRCYPPGGQPTPACPVTLSIGTIRKTLNVFGDRHWTSGATASPPMPFKVMDISWANALGGPGDEFNPAGKGLDQVQGPDGKWFQPLPNIEDPRHLVGSPTDRPQPAGLAPQEFGRPRQIKKIGTLDAAWLANGWPGVPDDMDPSLFQRAPEDQQLQGFFSGNEPIRLQHLHPTRTVIESQLPGFRVRFFVNHETAAGLRFEETPTRLETVWLFPEQEFGLLIWQAVVHLGAKDITQVEHALAFPEPLSEPPLPEEHYRAMLDPEAGPELARGISLPEAEAAAAGPGAGPAGSSLAEGALLTGLAESGSADASAAPTDATAPEPARKLSEGEPTGTQSEFGPAYYEAQAQEAENQIIAKLQAAGIDTEQYKALLDYPSPTDVPDLPSSPEERIQYYQDMAQEAEIQLKAKLRSAGIDPQAQPEIPSPFIPRTADQLIQSARGMGYEDQELFDFIRNMEEEIKKTEAELNAMGIEMPSGPWDRDLSRDSSGTEQPWPFTTKAEGQDRQGEGLEALTPTSPDQPEIEAAPGPTDPPTSREAILEKINSGQDLTGTDFSRVDLANADLSGADLSHTVLEGANLSGANLSGANLEGAILSGANLSGANLESARLKGVSASGLQARDANLTGADLSEADLTGAALPQVLASGADLTGTTLEGALLEGADLSHAQARGVDLTKANLDRARFPGANLQGGRLSSASMADTDFSGADLQKAWLAETRGPGARFAGANLKGSKVQGQAALPGADFSGANLEDAYWEDTDASQASFFQANLTRASFVQCNLSQADLRGVQAPSSRFFYSKLSQARASAANFFKGSFRRSNLDQTDFQDSNLFAADLYQAIYGHTNMKNANIQRTELTVRSTILK